jgi:N6-L-threonylcarbamoyladenine synthase
MDLMARPHLAWHLSGGTTELLLVEPEEKNVHAERIGGTSDISAGQLIDRTGRLLGLDFPAGKALDKLSGESQTKDFFRVKSDGLTFSFSGVQNKTEAYFSACRAPADTARYCLCSVCSAVVRTTKLALAQYPGFPVVFSGGVASNSLLREACTGFEAVFAPPQYSTDNAMGVAVLTWLQGE